MSKFIPTAVASLLLAASLTAQAQRVVTILELDDKSASTSQMQDPRTLVSNNAI